MIKRQFYRVEHRENDDDASSASSSSDESEKAASSGHDESDNEEVSSPDARQAPDRSDDDDEEEAEDNLPGSWSSDDEEEPIKSSQKSKASLSNQWSDLVDETLDDQPADFDDECVIMCKNVFKCRLCPKTICLSSQSMQSHLDSKKHARSVKLMKEGKLKVMLNSDGEEEEQGETHAERYARTVAQAETIKSEDQGPLKRKKPSGRQRQHKRAKRKALLALKEKNNVENVTSHNKSIQKNSDAIISDTV